MPDSNSRQSRQDRLAELARLRDRLAALTGRAESPDGLIRVTCTRADPLHTLELDPRTRALPAADLATAIQRTAAEARADLKRQSDEAIADSQPPAASPPPATPDRALRDHAAARDDRVATDAGLDTAVRDAMTEINHLRGHLNL